MNVQSSGWIIYKWNFYFDRYNKKYQLKNKIEADVERLKILKRSEKKEGTSKPYPQKDV